MISCITDQTVLCTLWTRHWYVSFLTMNQLSEADEMSQRRVETEDCWWDTGGASCSSSRLSDLPSRLDPARLHQKLLQSRHCETVITLIWCPCPTLSYPVLPCPVVMCHICQKQESCFQPFQTLLTPSTSPDSASQQWWRSWVTVETVRRLLIKFN